jgi:hypothetical protein
MPLRYSDMAAFPGLVHNIPPPQGYAIEGVAEMGRNERHAAELRQAEQQALLKAELDRQAEMGRNSRAEMKDQRAKAAAEAKEKARKQKIVQDAEKLRLDALNTGDPQLRGEMLSTAAEMYRSAGMTTGPDHGFQGKEGMAPPAAAPAATPAGPEPQSASDEPLLGGMYSRIRSALGSIVPEQTPPASPALEQAQGELMGQRIGRGVRGWIGSLFDGGTAQAQAESGATPPAAAAAPQPTAQPTGAEPTGSEMWAVHDPQGGRRITEVAPDEFDAAAKAEFDRFASETLATLTDPDEVKAWRDSAEKVTSAKLPYAKAVEKQYDLYNKAMGNLTAVRAAKTKAASTAKGKESQSFRNGQNDAMRMANSGGFELDATATQYTSLEDAARALNSKNSSLNNAAVYRFVRGMGQSGAQSDREMGNAFGDVGVWEKIKSIAAREADNEMSPFLRARLKDAVLTMLKQKAAQVGQIYRAMEESSVNSPDPEYRNGWKSYTSRAFSRYPGLIKGQGAGSGKPKAAAKDNTPGFLKELEKANAN